MQTSLLRIARAQLPGGRPRPSAVRLTHTPVPALLGLRAGTRLQMNRSQQHEKPLVVSSSPVDSQPSSSLDDTGLFDTSQCPHGNVIGIMRKRSEGVLICAPEESLEDIIPKLNKVTGLPVISGAGDIVGVISRKDIIALRKGMREGAMSDPVMKHMSKPAIVIDKDTTVRAAGDLMVEKNIRRLPVVDTETGIVMGIVSRSDIFKPLFKDAYDLFMSKEVMALGGGATVVQKTVVNKTDMTPVTWKLKYLYDGDCDMCVSLMNVLKRQDNNRDIIKFINIADQDYDPTIHMGIAYDEAMETIHAIRPDGSVIRGSDALKELFNAVGLGWATKISELPIVNKIVDLLYKFLSANRLSLGGAMDGIIAAKRMDMSKQGVETCGDMEEECTAEW